MPKRKVKKANKSLNQTSNNSTESNSTNISNSLTQPLAASSPRASVAQNLDKLSETVSLHEIKEQLIALKREYEEGLMRELDKAKSKLTNWKEKNFSEADLSRPATLEEIRRIRKQFLNCKNNNTENSIDVKRPLTENNSNVLPPIPEEEGDGPIGDNFASGSSGKEDQCHFDEVVGKSAKEKKSVVNNKSENSPDESVFKKPTAPGRKKAVKNSTDESAPPNSDKFRTPAMTRKRGYPKAMVTPGPDFAGPVSILRRPNPGEMAISLTGSPLLVSNSNCPNDVPQISIPLSDGRVVTVVANDELDPDMTICSEIDEATVRKLEKLQALLARKTKKRPRAQD